MKRDLLCLGLLCGAVCAFSGCAGTRNIMATKEANRPSRPDSFRETVARQQPESPRNSHYVSLPQANLVDLRPKPSTRLLSQPAQNLVVNQVNKPTVPPSPEIQPVHHEPKRLSSKAPSQGATLTLDGQTYRVQLLDESMDDRETSNLQLTAGEPSALPPPAPASLELDAGLQSEALQLVLMDSVPVDALQLNLPTALSMVGGQHPVVGFAQWQVQEAYARLDKANVLWLPSIQPGFSLHSHDGNYQASDGSIVDVNRSSAQFGLGSGATGAGTTPRPGLVAQFHLADAIFQPEIAEKTAWAKGHAATGVVNQQLLNVALAYLELLDAEQDLRIIQEAQHRTADLSKITGDFAATGQGLQADADRLQTELSLVENRLATARERIEVASAQLSQALSIDAGRRIVPLDPTVVPLELVSSDLDKPTLISTGLSNRPELKEAQALVSAACEQYKRQKYSPFVPSVLLGMSTGAFGGGLGSSNFSDTDQRMDFDAILSWEIRNLGFGESASREESQARIQQAKFEKIRILDQVAREISETHSQIGHRAKRMMITQNAIQTAQKSYDRNLSRIRDGQGLPLEVLQSVQALEDARRAYLKSVVEYNQAQFRLQWSLGWPVFAPAESH